MSPPASARAESNEGFTEPYDLPNDTAYAETCASVALAFWAQRMLHLDLDGAYADVMERALYNGALSGLSREGTHYFYANRLESRGKDRRWAWHPCPCCTMNVSRLVASIAGYFFSTSEAGIAVHLYGGAEAELPVAGTRAKIVETSDYPWSGDIRIAIDPETPAEFDLRLRIPDWAQGATATVNGAPIELDAERGYASLRRRWAKGDTIELRLPMLPERLYAHPDVRADVGRVALRRGPLIYCVEEADNPGGPVQALALPRSRAIEARPRQDIFGGAVVLEALAERSVTIEGAPLYAPFPPPKADVRLTALPYYLWANRDPGSMQVWIAESGETTT